MEWFRLNDFLEYIRTEFPEPMKYHFTFDLLENTIKYLMNQFEDNKYLAYTISQLIPEVTEEEVLRFCCENGSGNKQEDIKQAAAHYTGGNIYVYYGELSNGNFFIMADDWIDEFPFVLIVDKQPSIEESFYPEWQDAHKIEERYEKSNIEFWNRVIRFIINSEQKGNYLKSELEARLISE